MKFKRVILVFASLFLLTGCFSSSNEKEEGHDCTLDEVHYAFDENEHWLEINEGGDCYIPYGYNGTHEFEEHVVVEGDDTHDRVVEMICKACKYSKRITTPCRGNQFLEHTALKLSSDQSYYIIESLEYFNNEYDAVYFPTTYNNLPVKGIEAIDNSWASKNYRIIIPQGYTYLGENFLSTVGTGGFIFISSSITEIKEGALSNYKDVIYTSFSKEEGASIFSNVGFNGIAKVVYDVTSSYQPLIKDNIEYILDESNHVASVINIHESSRFNGKSTAANIPNIVDFNGNYRVTRIEDGACIEKIIDSNVFSNSNLTYIGKMAFYGCTFNDGVNIPTSLTSINESAFREATIKSLTFNEGLSRIEQYAFYGADIDEVVLPDSLEYIGMFAFAGCAFSEITLPATIKELGRDSFAGVRKAYFNCLDVTLFEEELDGDSKLSPFNDLREIVIGDGVTRVPAELCYKCLYMEKVTFSETVEVIGARAFMNTRRGNPSTDSTIVAQGRLIFPSSLKVIGANAFYESPFSSEHLTLPKTLEQIGAYAFYEAEFIEQFTYDGTTAEFNQKITTGENWNLWLDFWGEHYISVHCNDGDIS